MKLAGFAHGLCPTVAMLDSALTKVERAFENHDLQKAKVRAATQTPYGDQSVFSLLRLAHPVPPCTGGYSASEIRHKPCRQSKTVGVGCGGSAPT